MNLNFLKNISRECFNEVAAELMSHYCILKHDSRDNCDIIYRFAEIEFYLYDANEQNIDTSTYNRDCKCGEWFFHTSGVDIAFDTVRYGNELIKFGGILIRGIEIYKQNEQKQWKQIGVVGGPKLSMYEIFNHCSVMPDVIAIPDTFNTARKIGAATKRIGIEDNLCQRYVLDDVDWNIETEKIVENKDKTGKYHVCLESTSRNYNPKP